jgi:hypothetical protein
MEIAIPVNTSTLPLAHKLIEQLKQFGPYSGSFLFRVICTPRAFPECRQIFSVLPNTQIEGTLPDVVRRHPLGANEMFNHVMKQMTNQHWLYLTPDCVPLGRGWLDALDSEYLGAGKRYMGVAAYTPVGQVDRSGVRRVDHGEPFLLENAVYPANMAKLVTENLMSSTFHHEFVRRRSAMADTRLTNLILDRQFKDDDWIRGGIQVLAIRMVRWQTEQQQVKPTVQAPVAPPPRERAPGGFSTFSQTRQKPTRVVPFWEKQPEAPVEPVVEEAVIPVVEPEITPEPLPEPTGSPLNPEPEHDLPDETIIGVWPLVNQEEDEVEVSVAPTFEPEPHMEQPEPHVTPAVEKGLAATLAFLGKTTTKPVEGVIKNVGSQKVKVVAEVRTPKKRGPKKGAKSKKR